MIPRPWRHQLGRLVASAQVRAGPGASAAGGWADPAVREEDGGVDDAPVDDSDDPQVVLERMPHLHTAVSLSCPVSKSTAWVGVHQDCVGVNQLQELLLNVYKLPLK